LEEQVQESHLYSNFFKVSDNAVQEKFLLTEKTSKSAAIDNCEKALMLSFKIHTSMKMIP
jgi:hypothetical protein